jgi:hypothetical protein
MQKIVPLWLEGPEPFTLKMILDSHENSRCGGPSQPLYLTTDKAAKDGKR